MSASPRRARLPRRLRRLAPAVVGALLLAACWPVPGADSRRSAHLGAESALTPASVADLALAWEADLGATAAGPPAVVGAVYVRVGQEVFRVGLDSGATDWTWSLPDEAPDFTSVSDPLVIDGRVYIGFGIGNLGGVWNGHVLQARTGEPSGNPVAAGLLQTARGTLVVGETYAHGSGTPVIEGYRVTDVATGDTVSGSVALHDLGGGTSPARFTLAGDAVLHAGYGILPTAGGDWTQGGGVRSYPSGAGSACGPSELFVCPTWATPLAATTAVVLAPDGGTLYVGVDGGAVVALDRVTGAVMWTAPVGADVTATPALADGELFVPTAHGDLVAVDAASGAVLWSATVDGTALAGQPAVAGSGTEAVAFVGTEGGTLAAVAAAGCGAPTCGTPLWQAALGERVTGSPAINAGRLVVGTADGKVSAFHLPAG